MWGYKVKTLYIYVGVVITPLKILINALDYPLNTYETKLKKRGGGRIHPSPTSSSLKYIFYFSLHSIVFNNSDSFQDIYV